MDTNILVYLLDKTDLRKEDIAFSLLQRKGFVLPQVLFEYVNVCVRKLGHTKAKAVSFASNVYTTSYLQQEGMEVVEKAFDLFLKYNLQPFDSKIVASALVAGCTTLYSEDMQHGFVIENSLTIINPFL